MNGRFAKKLRRAAERATIGKPARRWVANRQTTTAGRKAVAAVNDPDSTRGVYRALKRAHSPVR